MTPSFLQVLICLILGIVLIIILTARYRVHAFFALLLACFVVGVGVQMPVPDILKHSKDGFGNIMRSLGFVIVLGTTLGGLLEYTGCTRVMADFILRKTGEKRAPLAMSLTGFIVGLPIFCDSGYIVLSGLNQSIAKKTGIAMSIMAVSLATGLYAVHCLLPPHPGAAAAAGTIGVEFGKLISIGVLVAIPAMLVGYWWALYAGKKWPGESNGQADHVHKAEEPMASRPSVIAAFLPVVVPILLIALHSFFVMEQSSDSGWHAIINVIGVPEVALSIGVLLAFAAGRNWKRDTVGRLLSESAEKAGGILVIIGGGGAFGAVLAATGLGKHLGSMESLASLGLFFPFLLTAVLKTAQGSSTVAIITTASIVLPLLPALGLDSENGKLITVLSMGAGSMVISHANDAYFWVIAKFSGLDMRTMLRVYTLASLWMGLITILIVYILSLFLLH
ncbi:GntP family permease [Pseudobacter ginsenosidimutans]|uniref:Putative D-glycerate permease n=1 Tax=Pseudobacter ginsenosidimutans TaxID=661488 RepID=A0A4Q7MTB6_9BACT|nr:GntP family permease [Pseudobacter ginsenosidimutans]RZS72075.1 putative D-glycerate permease [Pseudobacter ginsenosidimutans]